MLSLYFGRSSGIIIQDEWRVSRNFVSSSADNFPLKSLGDLVNQDVKLRSLLCSAFSCQEIGYDTVKRGKLINGVW